MSQYELILGNAKEALGGLGDGSVHAIITSPPY